MALGRGGLPHDLVQMVVEGTLGIEDGFWASMAAGATFKSTGRKRTRPGREVIATNRNGIAAAEAIVGDHYSRWQKGKPTPTAPRFEEISRLWAELADREELTLEWPTLRAVLPDQDSSRGLTARAIGWPSPALDGDSRNDPNGELSRGRLGS